MRQIAQIHIRQDARIHQAGMHRLSAIALLVLALALAPAAAPVWAAAGEAVDAEPEASLPLAASATAEADKLPEAAQNRQQVAEMPRGVMQLDETVISGNQELPKVLYILPWREPQGLPDIEIQAEFTEAEVFRRLYPPAYRRELSYFETLRGLQENTSPDQEE